MLSAILATVAAVTLVAGCSDDVDAAAATGNWTSDEGGHLDLSQAGTFTADGLKNEIFDDNHRSGETHSGSGTWTIVTGNRCVDLVFTDVSGAALAKKLPMQRAVYCSGSHDSLRLYFVIGDPDDHNYYYFHKTS